MCSRGERREAPRRVCSIRPFSREGASLAERRAYGEVRRPRRTCLLNEPQGEGVADSEVGEVGQDMPGFRCQAKEFGVVLLANASHHGCTQEPAFSVGLS